MIGQDATILIIIIALILFCAFMLGRCYEEWNK